MGDRVKVWVGDWCGWFRTGYVHDSTTVGADNMVMMVLVGEGIAGRTVLK